MKTSGPGAGKSDAPPDGISIKSAKDPGEAPAGGAGGGVSATAQPGKARGTEEGVVETAAVDEAELEKTKKTLEEKEKLLAEYADLLKRKQAEFENFKKRVQREVEENKKYATTGVILDTLSILDNFERAVESTRSSKDFEALIEGIIISNKQFKTLLEKNYGVKSIDAVGKEFNPNLHDAIMFEESGDCDRDTVIEVFQKGYSQHDRVIRHSKVKVKKSALRAGESLSGIYDNQEEEASEKGRPSDKGV